MPKKKLTKKKKSGHKAARKAAKREAKVQSKNGELQMQSRNRLLRTFTEDALKSYFKNLNGHKPVDIYKMVLGEVEPPLLQSVMEYTNKNQTVAAEILGINRATLRKKLKQYNLNNSLN